ncbi:MAG: marine proteobacterial sortase target protein [Gammaproteobacteria bacterium]|nr:marine proteobacterial sortase target protein [Gammaproteobacteria bacterium]
MLSLNKNIFKRRPRREYLHDKYKPHKSNLMIWLQRLIIFILISVITLFLMLLSDIVKADSSSDNFPQVSLDNVSNGSLLIKNANSGLYKQIPLLETFVDMSISGMIVRSHIKQQFKNTSNNWVEAVYVFPLPEMAAVDHMRMLIGERVIEGMIKEKAEAKRIYNEAKRDGKKSALVEQERPNLFTNTVANIAPGESISIEIEYQQTLHYDQGSFSLRFPMAITPRYIPGKVINESISLTNSGWAKNTHEVIDANRITPHVNLSNSLINPVSINIKLNAGFPLQNLTSRYHNIIKQQVNNTYHIKLADGITPSDRDFELVWTPQLNHIPKAAVFNETLKSENYQMLMLMPPDNGAYNGQPLARDVTYIIDTSGSMHGTSMQQARASLLMALDRLRLHDKFNIIQFNSITEQVFSDSQIASFENILIAKKYVNQLSADGGTEMAPALNLALKGKSEDNTVQQVIFITDGSVGNEADLFDIIHNNLADRRLFTIGIGSAPNSYFMRKAAQFGRGSYTYISNVNEVNEKMSALFSKLESPLMTDIKLSFDGSQTAEIWPQRIPDLYQGEPLILAIKSAKPLSYINITGSRALAPWSAKLNLNINRSSKGIATFWARKKISALMDSIHEGADKEQVRTDIIDVALNHHLVSKHTSLVAVDKTPSRPNEAKLDKRSMPVNLPHGQNPQKIFGQLAQTATSAELNIICGFTLLMLGLALTVLLRGSELETSHQTNHEPQSL